MKGNFNYEQISENESININLDMQNFEYFEPKKFQMVELDRKTQEKFAQVKK